MVVIGIDKSNVTLEDHLHSRRTGLFVLCEI